MGVPRNATLRQVYAKLRKEFTAADLQKFTESEPVVAADQLLGELEAIHRAEINVNAAGIGGTGGTVSSRGGGTNLYDAIYLACHDELGSEAGRKAVIVLSDAEDTGSKMSLDQAIESAERGDAVIHVMLISDPGAR